MKHILWVDDNIESFESFNFLIEKSYTITRAEDYENAVLLLNERDFDLIIVDIIIPDGRKPKSLDDLIIKKNENNIGLRLIKFIRENGFTQPIIALTVVNNQSFIDEVRAVDENITILWKYVSDAQQLNDKVEKLIR